MSNCQSIFAFRANVFDFRKLQNILTILATFIDLTSLAKAKSSS